MKQEFKQPIELGKSVIKLIFNRGYEAYFTGEIVRNLLLDKDIQNIEISTNAPLEVVVDLFKNYKQEKVKPYILAIHYENITLFIRRFQDEYRKSSKEKSTFRDSDDIIADLKTRIFTIDALAMNTTGKLTDICGGYLDTTRKKIKFVGDARGKLIDSPLSALEAMALISELGFTLDYKSFLTIKRSKSLKNISLEEMLTIIERILKGKYFKQALFYILKTKIYKYIPIMGLEFASLAKKFQKIDYDLIIAKALTRNGEIDEDLLSICENKDFIKKVVDLAIVTPKSQYDPILLFNYGLDIALAANKVNNLLGNAQRKTRKIENEYKDLPIKTTCELKYKGENVLKDYPEVTGPQLVDIVEEIKYKVLMKELPNDYDELKVFALGKLSSYQKLPFEEVSYEENVSEIPKINKEEFNFPQKREEKEFKEIKLEEKRETEKNNFTNFQLSIEKRLSEYEKILSEKDAKINALEKNNLRNQLNNDVDLFMHHHYEALDKLNIYGQKRERISREIKNAYEYALVDNLEKYEKLRDEYE